MDHICNTGSHFSLVRVESIHILVPVSNSSGANTSTLDCSHHHISLWVWYTVGNILSAVSLLTYTPLLHPQISDFTSSVNGSFFHRLLWNAGMSQPAMSVWPWDCTCRLRPLNSSILWTGPLLTRGLCSLFSIFCIWDEVNFLWINRIWWFDYLVVWSVL